MHVLILLAVGVVIALASYAAYRVAQRNGGVPGVASVTASVLSVFAATGSTFAQSDGINIAAIDLANFYSWFNDMFATIFPIALIGAGISAGIAFAFAVANIISKAFSGLRA